MTTAIRAVTMGTMTPLPKSKAPSEVSIVKPQKKEPVVPRYVRYTRGWYSSGPPQGQAALRRVRYGTRSRQVRVRHGCGTSYIFMFMSTPEGAITDRAALRERVGD